MVSQKGAPRDDVNGRRMGRSHPLREKEQDGVEIYDAKENEKRGAGDGGRSWRLQSTAKKLGLGESCLESAIEVSREAVEERETSRKRDYCQYKPSWYGGSWENLPSSAAFAPRGR